MIFWWGEDTEFYCKYQGMRRKNEISQKFEVAWPVPAPLLSTTVCILVEFLSQLSIEVVNEFRHCV